MDAFVKGHKIIKQNHSLISDGNFSPPLFVISPWPEQLSLFFILSLFILQKAMNMCTTMNNNRTINSY